MKDGKKQGTAFLLVLKETEEDVRLVDCKLKSARV